MRHTLSLAAALAALAAPAAAQDLGGVYLRAHGGYFAPSATDTGVQGEVEDGQLPEFDITGQREGEADGGVVFGGLIGAMVSERLAVEAEVTFRSYDFEPREELTSTIGGPALAEGDVQTTSYMVNAVYHLQKAGRFTPYIGAGAGYAVPGGQFDVYEGDFAYQVKAGVSTPIWFGHLGVEASYFGAADFETEFDVTATDPVSGFEETRTFSAYAEQSGAAIMVTYTVPLGE